VTDVYSFSNFLKQLQALFKMPICCINGKTKFSQIVGAESCKQKRCIGDGQNILITINL